MQAFRCELCGGTELVKVEELFVCQHCRAKYTAELVQGLLSGAEAETDRSKALENMLLNARRAYEDGIYSEALRLYSDVLNIDPDNPHAMLYHALSSAWTINWDSPRVPNLLTPYLRAVEQAIKRATIWPGMHKKEGSANGEEQRYVAVFMISGLAEITKVLFALAPLAIEANDAAFAKAINEALFETYPGAIATVFVDNFGFVSPFLAKREHGILAGYFYSVIKVIEGFDIPSDKQETIEKALFLLVDLQKVRFPEETEKFSRMELPARKTEQ